MKENLFELNIENYEIGKSVIEFVDFPSFYGLQKVSAPVFVYRGSEEIHPCVVVTSCIHGDEINGLRISQSIMNGNLTLIKGTLIVVPVVNIYGFLNKQRYLPDRKDLNRCFPGQLNGSFGSRFAYFILQRIIKYGDVFIDLHSGGAGRFNVPQIRCDLNTKGINDLIRSLSIPLVVNSTIRDGSLREALNDLGKKSIVFEGGEGLRVDETITKYGVNLVKSVLSYHGMIKSKKKFIDNKVIIKRTKWIRAKEGGFLINKASYGKVVKKGELVGQLRDVTGKLLTSIKMENDGVILGLSKSALIMSGDALYNIGFMDDKYQTEEDEFFDYFDFEI